MPGTGSRWLSLDGDYSVQGDPQILWGWLYTDSLDLKYSTIFFYQEL